MRSTTSVGYANFARSSQHFRNVAINATVCAEAVWVAGFEKRAAVAYIIAATGDVEIERIFHGRRDYEFLLRESGEDVW